jgi:hypothetical protein
MVFEDDKDLEESTNRSGAPKLQDAATVEQVIQLFRPYV